MDVPYRTVAETTITYMKSLRNIQLKLLASMMYAQHRFSLILCRQFANRMCVKQQFNHPADPRHDIINHSNGSFDGIPAFLGYFFPVLLIFLIYTRDLSISVSGSLNLSTFSITPPRILTAFFDF